MTIPSEPNLILRSDSLTFSVLQKLGSLPVGWAGVGSVVISAEAICAAGFILHELETLFMPFPIPKPTKEGGISLEWTTHTHQLLLVIDGEGNAVYRTVLARFDELVGEMTDQKEDYGMYEGSECLGLLLAWLLEDEAKEA